MIEIKNRNNPLFDAPHLPPPSTKQRLFDILSVQKKRHRVGRVWKIYFKLETGQFCGKF